MEQEKKYLIFLVVAASVVVVVLLAIAIDIVFLYRKRKRLSDAEIKRQIKKVDELVLKAEQESVDALLKGKDNERKRIAQELHDRLGSVLFTAKLHYKQLVKNMDALKKKQQESYQQVTFLLDEAFDEVRRISHDLYESTLAKFGYGTALRQLIAAIEGSNSIRIEFKGDPEIPKRFRYTEKELYRITQELLSNTFKHSEAGHVTIELTCPDEGVFEFNYADDGKGFSINDHQENGIGLKSIRARAEKVNGMITFESQLNSGMKCNIKFYDSSKDKN